MAAIGNGAAFAKGRDFGASFGLVPKQMSTGDRTILGRISSRMRCTDRKLTPTAFAMLLRRVAIADNRVK